MKYDAILTNYLGEFGLYQKYQFCLVCLPSIFLCMHALSWTFTGADIPHRCLVTNESDTGPFLPNNSYAAYFWNNDTEQVIQSCKRLVGVNAIEWNLPVNTSDEEECEDGYKWKNTGDLSYTASQRWEFVCKRFWLKAFIQAVYYMGQFFGSLVFGILSDKFGRKKAFFFAISILVFCGSAMSIVPYWPLFMIFRIGVGFAHPGIFLLGVILSVELVGPSYRIYAGGVVNGFFAFGQVSLAVLAYFLRDYRHLQLAISLPALIFSVYLCLLNESPRWLISQARFLEADAILQKAVKCNKTAIPEHWYRHVDTQTVGVKNEYVPAQQQTHSYRDLLRTPNVRKRTLICSLVCWPAAAMAYYGLAMNPSFLGGDKYLTFVIGGILDVFMSSILLIVNTVGRKSLIIFGFLLTSLFLFATLCIPDGYISLKTALVLMGKMCLTATISIIYVFTPELFPTIIRSMAVGMCSTVARLGVIGSSFISLYLVESSTAVVTCIYASLCLFAGIMTLFLPETSGQIQFESIQEAETDQPLFTFAWQIQNRKREKNAGSR